MFVCVCVCAFPEGQFEKALVEEVAFARLDDEDYQGLRGVVVGVGFGDDACDLYVYVCVCVSVNV